METAEKMHLSKLATEHASLRMLVLFGSRARGQEHSGSDWDLGYLAEDSFDVEGFLAEAVLVLGSDRVDLVDLDRAGGLLRFRAAREGVVIFEREPGVFEDFSIEAARFWYDAGPLFEHEYRAYLEELREAR